MLTIVVDIINFALFCVLININRIVYRQQDCFLTLNSQSLFSGVAEFFRKKSLNRVIVRSRKFFALFGNRLSEVELKKSINILLQQECDYSSSFIYSN